MLLGIISDTHDRMSMVRKARSLFRERDITTIVHAGDFISPFVIPLFEEFLMYGTFGNNDGEKKGLIKVIESFGSIFSPPYFFNWQEKRFALLHEQFDVDKLDGTGEFDVIVYGHLHTAEIRRGKALIINPGETGGWLYGRSTIAILDCKSMKAELIEL